jgi:hypothetical protein
MDPSAADVNCDNTIDIVDALLIAQYYIGLVDDLECLTETPAPTSVPSPTPTPEPPICFVEPYTLFFQRLREMCGLAIDTLDNSGMMVTHKYKFQDIYDWAVLFEDIAQKQLDGDTVTPDEYNHIHKFWQQLVSFFSTASFVPEINSKARVVTDIFTFEDTVLHEGVGNIHPLIVVYPEPGDTGALAAVGYVLSYYEFLENDNVRLSDEEWADDLDYSPPSRPEWTDVFIE